MLGSPVYVCVKSVTGDVIFERPVDGRAHTLDLTFAICREAARQPERLRLLCRAAVVPQTEFDLVATYATDGFCTLDFVETPEPGNHDNIGLCSNCYEYRHLWLADRTVHASRERCRACHTKYEQELEVLGILPHFDNTGREPKLSVPMASDNSPFGDNGSGKQHAENIVHPKRLPGLAFKLQHGVQPKLTCSVYHARQCLHQSNASKR